MVRLNVCQLKARGDKECRKHDGNMTFLSVKCIKWRKVISDLCGVFSDFTCKLSFALILFPLPPNINTPSHRKDNSQTTVILCWKGGGPRDF